MLIFIYKDAKGNISERKLETWSEDSLYLQGYCQLSKMPKTYRKDRIVEVTVGSNLLLGDKAPAAKAKRNTPEPQLKLQILFTGFKSAERLALEQRAEEYGLQVMKTVSKSLTFLCIGENAGPSKVKKAYENGAFILSAYDLETMLTTGEIIV